jgi:hypothetical protein
MDSFQATWIAPDDSHWQGTKTAEGKEYYYMVRTSEGHPVGTPTAVWTLPTGATMMVQPQVEKEEDHLNFEDNIEEKKKDLAEKGQQAYEHVVSRMEGAVEHLESALALARIELSKLKMLPGQPSV